MADDESARNRNTCTTKRKCVLSIHTYSEDWHHIVSNLLWIFSLQKPFIKIRSLGSPLTEADGVTHAPMNLILIQSISFFRHAGDFPNHTHILYIVLFPIQSLSHTVTQPVIYSASTACSTSSILGAAALVLLFSTSPPPPPFRDSMNSRKH